MDNPVPLFIDIGNSYWKVATYQQGVWILCNKGIQLSALQNWLFNQPERELVLASVGNVTEVAQLKESLRANGFQIKQVEVGGYPGFIHSYEEPSRLGVDRWLALLAMVGTGELTGVLDLGTAATFDALDQTGKHLGGWIAPGKTLLVNSLITQSEKLKQQFEGDENVAQSLGTDTRAAIQAGTEVMLAGFCIQACQYLMKQFPTQKINLVLTGGSAKSVLPFIKKETNLGVEHRPYLVFEGMYLWWLIDMKA